MQPKTLGDLRHRSKSFADFATIARHRRDWVLGKATDQIIDKLLPKGIPDNLEDMLKDQGKFFLVWLEASMLSSSVGRRLHASAPAQKLAHLAQKVPAMEQALRAIARSGVYKPLERMYLVAEANHLNLDHSSMRIVDSHLTPYQAQSQCNWQGTLAEFRSGSIVSGPADAHGHFAIYFPNERHKLRGDFAVTCVTCEFQ